MAETGQEKTEQATGKKLSETRDKGQVARSMELNSFAIFGVGIMLIFLTKNLIAEKVSEASGAIFGSLDKLKISQDLLQTYAYEAFKFFISVMSPFFGGLVLIALVTGYGQVGFKITPKAFAPKFTRFNPINGLKNLFFSSRGVIEVLKSVLKLTIVGVFTYSVISDAVKQALGLVNYSVASILSFVVEVSYKFMWKMAMVYALFAAADFAYQKYKFKKDIKMTKQEVKEEMKSTEGDPLIKGQIKSKQMAMARNRMMKNVPKADVVITNPTHFAVALKYQQGAATAPKVLAKGQDLVAQRIKEIARQNDVPIYEDVPLARALYKVCEVGDEIPENLYKAVAQILAYIYKLKNAKKKKSII